MNTRLYAAHFTSLILMFLILWKYKDTKMKFLPLIKPSVLHTPHKF